MNKVKCKHTKEIVYFKFFASMKYPNCFWYTKTTENTGFDLGKIHDYVPINNTWEQIRKSE